MSESMTCAMCRGAGPNQGCDNNKCSLPIHERCGIDSEEGDGRVYCSRTCMPVRGPGLGGGLGRGARDGDAGYVAGTQPGSHWGGPHPQSPQAWHPLSPQSFAPQLWPRWSGQPEACGAVCALCAVRARDFFYFQMGIMTPMQVPVLTITTVTPWMLQPAVGCLWLPFGSQPLLTCLALLVQPLLALAGLQG